MEEFYAIITHSWHYWRALILGRADEFGPTQLQEAAFCGHIGTLRSYLENGADVNEAGIIGISPLSAAIYGGHEEVVQILLEHGATTTGAGVNKALRYAVAHGYADVVQLLRESRK